MDAYYETEEEIICPKCGHKLKVAVQGWLKLNHH